MIFQTKFFTDIKDIFQLIALKGVHSPPTPSPAPNHGLEQSVQVEFCLVEYEHGAFIVILDTTFWLFSAQAKVAHLI